MNENEVRTDFAIAVEADLPYDELYQMLADALQGGRFPGATSRTLFWRSNVISLEHAMWPEERSGADAWIGYRYRVYAFAEAGPEAELREQVKVAEAFMERLHGLGIRAHLYCEFFDLVDEKWRDV